MDQATKKALKRIYKLIKNNKRPVLGLATGSTPLLLYKKLIEKYKKGELDFSNTVIFHLDEYIGSNKYKRYLKENLLDHINIKEKNCHFLNGQAKDLKKEIKRYQNLIKQENEIDLQILGIGRDGHIGFNEPTVVVDNDFLAHPDHEKIKNYNKFILKVPGFQYEKAIKKIINIRKKQRKNIKKELPNKSGNDKLARKIKNQKITIFLSKNKFPSNIKLSAGDFEFKNIDKAFSNDIHKEELAFSTIYDNSDNWDNLDKEPVKALTFGTSTILNAKEILLLAKGGRKAKIIKKFLQSKTSVELPASVLNLHSDTKVFLDQGASSLVSIKRDKSWLWKLKFFLIKNYLKLNNKPRFLTLDLGGTHCRASLKNKQGNLLFPNLKLKTLSLQGEKIILNQIIKLITPLLEIGNRERTKILIAIAGKLDKNKEVIKESKNLGLKNFFLKEKIKNRLSFPIKEIEIVNDLVAGWYGEKSKLENDNFLTLYTSTGVGAAFKDKNLEPGWTISVQVNKLQEIKNAKYLGFKNENDFYKLSSLKDNEYFLEGLTGGKGLAKFAKDQAEYFPKSKIAKKIVKGDIKDKNIPKLLTENSKSEDKFSKYCLLKTGQFAGVGIAVLYNHFLKNEKIFNKNTKVFLNGPLSFNYYYFKGIKKGFKTGKGLDKKTPKNKNLIRSHFKNSTNGIQKGLIFYYQNLIHKRKKYLPESGEEIIFSDKELSPRVKTWPIPENQNIVLLEKEDSKIFAGNFLKELRNKNNIKTINLDNNFKSKIDSNANLIMAPENINKEFKFKKPVIFYKSFPKNKKDLNFNTYFDFDKRLLEFLLKSIKAHKKEVERTRYDIYSKSRSKYFGKLLNYFSISNLPFGHGFNMVEIKNGKEIKKDNLISIKDIFKNQKGKSIFISPHSDDIEISAGAFVRWLIEKNKKTEDWVITESHGQVIRREVEANRACKVLSNANNHLKLDFSGFNVDNLTKSQVKEKISSKIKNIHNFKFLFLPSLNDSHPTHIKVTKLLKEQFKKEFDNFIIFYYFSPWFGKYNAFYNSKINFGNSKEKRIASILKAGIGQSGILGELCGEFNNRGFFADYIEPLKYNNQNN